LAARHPRNERCWLKRLLPASPYAKTAYKHDHHRAAGVVHPEQLLQLRGGLFICRRQVNEQAILPTPAADGAKPLCH